MVFGGLYFGRGVKGVCMRLYDFFFLLVVWCYLFCCSFFIKREELRMEGGVEERIERGN